MGSALGGIGAGLFSSGAANNRASIETGLGQLSQQMQNQGALEEQRRRDEAARKAQEEQQKKEERAARKKMWTNLAIGAGVGIAGGALVGALAPALAATAPVTTAAPVVAGESVSTAAGTITPLAGTTATTAGTTAATEASLAGATGATGAFGSDAAISGITAATAPATAAGAGLGTVGTGALAGGVIGGGGSAATQAGGRPKAPNIPAPPTSTPPAAYQNKFVPPDIQNAMNKASAPPTQSPVVEYRPTTTGGNSIVEQAPARGPGYGATIGGNIPAPPRTPPRTSGGLQPVYDAGDPRANDPFPSDAKLVSKPTQRTDEFSKVLDAPGDTTFNQNTGQYTTTQKPQSIGRNMLTGAGIGLLSALPGGQVGAGLLAQNSRAFNPLGAARQDYLNAQTAREIAMTPMEVANWASRTNQNDAGTRERDARTRRIGEETNTIVGLRDPLIRKETTAGDANTQQAYAAQMRGENTAEDTRQDKNAAVPRWLNEWAKPADTMAGAYSKTKTGDAAGARQLNTEQDTKFDADLQPDIERKTKADATGAEKKAGIPAPPTEDDAVNELIAMSDPYLSNGVLQPGGVPNVTTWVQNNQDKMKYPRVIQRLSDMRFNSNADYNRNVGVKDLQLLNAKLQSIESRMNPKPEAEWPEEVRAEKKRLLEQISAIGGNSIPPPPLK